MQWKCLQGAWRCGTDGARGSGSGKVKLLCLTRSGCSTGPSSDQSLGGGWTLFPEAELISQVLQAPSDAVSYPISSSQTPLLLSQPELLLLPANKNPDRDIRKVADRITMKINDK